MLLIVLTMLFLFTLCYLDSIRLVPILAWKFSQLYPVFPNSGLKLRVQGQIQGNV